MRIGISANMLKNGYDRWGDDKYKKLKEHGFSCVDYGMVDTNDGVYSFDDNQFEEFMKKEKALAEASGIEVSQVHGPWRYPPQDSTAEDRAERLEKMKKSIRGAALLGCKYWVVHPIMPCGLIDLKDGTMEKTRELNLQFMNELLKTAKEYGVIICLENMPMLNFSISTPTQILNFVNEINDENFKICLDTGHVNVFEDLSVADAVYELGDKLTVLHVHDNSGVEDEHLAPFSGGIDWVDFSKALKETGFDGVISLETLPDGNLDDLEYEKECIKLSGIAKKLAE